MLAGLRPPQRAVSLRCLSAPVAVFPSEACPEPADLIHAQDFHRYTGRAHVLTGPWAFLLQTHLLPIGEAHFNGKQLLSLAHLPGCCSKSCPDTRSCIITQGAYLWLELFFWENPLCRHQGLLGAFYLQRASGEVLDSSPPALAQQLFATCRNKPRGELKPSNQCVAGGDTGDISHTAGRMCPARGGGQRELEKASN